MSTVTETSEWIRGVEFARFLRSHKVRDIELPGGTHSGSNRITKWEAGERLSVWKADRVLTQLGYTIHQLPESAWYPPSYSPFSQRNHCNGA